MPAVVPDWGSLSQFRLNSSLQYRFNPSSSLLPVEVIRPEPLDCVPTVGVTDGVGDSSVVKRKRVVKIAKKRLTKLSRKFRYCCCMV